MRKLLLGVVTRFLLAYAIVTSVWLAGVEHFYDDALAWTGMRVLAAVERPRLTTSLRREGTQIIAEHLQYFAAVPPQATDTRRVHSNTALFAALTVATPNVSWAARGLWLVGGGALLSASHLAHLLTYVHWRYALHNVGPYACGTSPEQLWQLGMDQLWRNPPCLRRRFVLAGARMFNVSLQRVIPCVLWLPLFLRGFGHRTITPARRRWSSQLRYGALGGVAMIGAAALVIGQGSRAPVPTEIEGIRLGMGAITAKKILTTRGYTWTESARPRRQDHDLWSGFVDVWPPRLLPQQGRPRYNWIGLRITQPPGGQTIALGCITGIDTAPSATLPEAYRREADNLATACAEHWHAVEAAAAPSAR